VLARLANDPDFKPAPKGCGDCHPESTPGDGQFVRAALVPA